MITPLTNAQDAIPTQTVPFRIAIIGAGITGINLALGLQERGIPFTLYERAPAFGEIGAGIGFSPNAERAMGIISKKLILDAFRRTANPNGEDYFQWIDGWKTDELIFKLHVGKDGFQGCKRSEILEEWAKGLDPERVVFGKTVDLVVEKGDNDSGSGSDVEITFTDGTTANADVVIGCDGIRSRIRQIILSPYASPPSTSSTTLSNSMSPPPPPPDFATPNTFLRPVGGRHNSCPPSVNSPPTSVSFLDLPPSAHPHYTSKYCFRALIPMAKALSALGEARALTRFMYNGPNAHIITYPIGGNTVLNVLVVLTDKNPWPFPHKHTADAAKQEALDAFAGWHPTARKIVELFPDDQKMDKWAIFDMAAYPAPHFHKGKVCVAGDAAHATGPHLGAGGGLGIEDALVLSELLKAVYSKLSDQENGEEQRKRKGKLVEAALDSYNEVRYERTQKVVQLTRNAVDLFQWRDGNEAGVDAERFGGRITKCFHTVWDYDVERMVHDAVAGLEGRAMV